MATNQVRTAVTPQVVTQALIQAMFWPALIAGIGTVARIGYGAYTGYKAYKSMRNK